MSFETRAWVGPVPRTFILALYLLALTTLCFRPWMPDVLFGDDLANYWSYADGAFFRSFHQVLFSGFVDKYRPVSALAMKVLYDAFGPHMGPVLCVNVALNVVAGLLVERLAFALSGRRLAISVLAATMTVVSRFLLYQVTEFTSILEAIGYVLFLAMLAAVAALYDERAAARGRGLGLAALAVALEWLLILDHERYVAVAPWLAVALWAAPPRRELTLAARSWPPLAALAAIAFDVAYKAVVLRQAVMVGTGGSRLGLSVPDVVDHAVQALASVLAFNHGPEYLVGRDLLAQPYDWLLFPAGVFALVFVTLLVVGVFAPQSEEGADPANPRSNILRSLIPPVALVVLAAMILAPPMATIRLEQRWLVQPFALLVLVGAWAAGRLAERLQPVALALFGVWALASVTVDIGLHRGFLNIFFIANSEGAHAVEHDVLEHLPSSAEAVVMGPSDLCTWGLGGPNFAKLYVHRPDALRCIGDPDGRDAAFRAAPAGSRIYRIVPGQPTLDITDLVLAERSFETEGPSLDLLARFDEGHINDPRPIGTPSGKGVLLFPFDRGAGPLKGMAVVTSFSYRLDHVPVRLGDRLNFDLAMALASKDPARAIVTVAGADGKPVQVYSGLAPVHPKVGLPPVTHVSIPVGRFAPEVSITFAGETPAGADPAAQWVEYVRPRILPGPHP